MAETTLTLKLDAGEMVSELAALQARVEAMLSPKTIPLRIVHLPHAVALPAYATSGAAAMDIHAANTTPIRLGAGQRTAVPTGLMVAVPAGFALKLYPRSGLALKNGIALANGVAVIDEDFRGEIMVLLVNLSSEIFIVERGTRIAQAILEAAPRIELVEVEALEGTARGSGGMGSTGV